MEYLYTDLITMALRENIGTKKKQKYSGVSEGCLLILPTQWDKFNNQLQSVNMFKLIIDRQ